MEIMAGARGQPDLANPGITIALPPLRDPSSGSARGSATGAGAARVGVRLSTRGRLASMDAAGQTLRHDIGPDTARIQ